MEEPITIACATRGRPANFARMADSIRETATTPIRIVAGVDDDDETLRNYPKEGVRYVVSRRGTTGTAWNSCLITGWGCGVLLLGDDAIMETPGWDKIIREYSLPGDGIYVLNFMDVDRKGNQQLNGWHNFLGRGWLDVTGYITPPIFQHWYHESWNNEIARKIGRLYVIKEIRIKHLFDETFSDKTNTEARARGKIVDGKTWEQSAGMREQDAKRLREHMRRG